MLLRPLFVARIDGPSQQHDRYENIGMMQWSCRSIASDFEGMSCSLIFAVIEPIHNSPIEN